MCGYGQSWVGGLPEAKSLTISTLKTLGRRIEWMIEKSRSPRLRDRVRAALSEPDIAHGLGGGPGHQSRGHAEPAVVVDPGHHLALGGVAAV